MGFTKKKKIIVGAGICLTIAGGVSCLQLCRHSQHQKQTPETSVVTATPVENLNVCDYSMKSAFEMGLIHSVGDYVEKTPYKLDTVKLNINNLDNIKKGYYTIITTGDSIQDYITLNYIEVDTTDMPDPMKKLLLKFADQANDSLNQKGTLAHETLHRDCQQQQKFNMRAQERADFHSLQEIMGRFRDFILIREEYKKNNDPSIFKANYRFYYYALKRGDIDPFSQDSLCQRQEQLFVLNNLAAQFEQSNTYDKEISDALKDAPEYDASRPNEYQRALDHMFTVIWDGKLININPISTGEMKAPQLPENTQILVNCLTAKEEYKNSNQTQQKQFINEQLQNWLQQDSLKSH